MQLSNILVIIQRSNGDVFLSSSLINQIKKHFNPLTIDLLVNDDTLPIAETISEVNKIYTFSYKKKKEKRWRQELEIFKKIYKKYDLSINLTASDRSVVYAIIASKFSISAIEQVKYKSWWKTLFLNHSYYFDFSKHILKNNLEPLKLLGFKPVYKLSAPKSSKESNLKIKFFLNKLKIDRFLIFHPSAQYSYKTLPVISRNQLVARLNELDIPIIVTGGRSEIDLLIKNSLPKLKNIVDFIGETSIEEYISLSQLSEGYIGMDTLNMHIAASQNKRIFGIFGPTILSMWSPWSNSLEASATINLPIQTYANITIFQADMECVACGLAGCNNFGVSDCLYKIQPNEIYDEILRWKNNNFIDC
jgi:heptosyltransferase III